MIARYTLDRTMFTLRKRSNSLPAIRAASKGSEKGEGEKRKDEFRPVWENKEERDKDDEVNEDSLVSDPISDSKIRILISKCFKNEQMNEKIRQAVEEVLDKGYRYYKKHILPPNSFAEEKEGTSLRRLRDLTFLFHHVPEFDNSNKDNHIKAFLSSMNAAVAEINCEISAREFRHCLLSKLSSPIRILISKTFKNNISLTALYHILSVLYDETLTSEAAWIKLTNPSSLRFKSLTDMLERILTLMENAKVCEHTRAPLLVAILKKHISTCLYDKLIEFKLEVENSRGKQVTMSILMDFLSRYRHDIDEQLNRTEKTNRKNVREPVKGTRSSQSHCNVVHGEQKQMSDAKSSKKHAMIKYARCKLCGRNHNTKHCHIYNSVPVVAGVCRYCLDSMNLNLFHPMAKCRNKPPKVKKGNKSQIQIGVLA